MTSSEQETASLALALTGADICVMSEALRMYADSLLTMYGSRLVEHDDKNNMYIRARHLIGVLSSAENADFCNGKKKK